MKIVFSNGKYSQEYVNFFLKHFGASPFNNCLKKTLNQYLLPFFINDIPVIPTDTEIKFGEIPFGFQFDEILKTKGSPNCFTVENIENSILKVVRYNEKVLKSSMNVTYFFMDDLFYFGEYRFSDVTYLNTNEVIRSLAKRYNIKLPESSDKFMIGDAAGNSIFFFFNGIHLSIYYYSRFNAEINKSLDEYMSKKETSGEEDTDIGSILERHF